MTKDMTTGNPTKLILLFSVPIIFGNLFQQFYNMMDAIIVGQCLGEDALAAVGATGSIMFLVLGFSMGIAQGFGVMVSQVFGSGDQETLKACCCTFFPVKPDYLCHIDGNYGYNLKTASHLHEYTG